MRLPIGLVVAWTTLACGAQPATQTRPTMTAAAELKAPPRAPVSAPNAATTEGPPPPAPRCRLTVTNTEGCEPRDVEVLIAPVRTRIENCRGTSGGKLRIRVRRQAGRLAFDVEPGSSLDPTERQCVLDALSTVRDGESSTEWSGGNARPTGFTSLLTLEW